MNGNERIGAESLFEPAFDIDGQLMGAEHAHPRIDADMGFDGDGGSDTACAQMVRFGHLLRVSQDVSVSPARLRREGHVRAVLRGRFAAGRTRS